MLLPRFMPMIFPLLILCASPTGASPAQPPTNLRSDIIYTSRGEFVQVSPMRQLTLNAHIQQFAYEPLGIEVALVGSEVQGDQTVHFVKTMDVRTGGEMNRLTVIAPSENDSAGFSLIGWSESGKYLLVERTTPAPHNFSVSADEYLRWDLSADPPATRSIDPAAYFPGDAQVIFPLSSPILRWVMFKGYYQSPDTAGKLGPQQSAYVRYDVERDTYQLLTLPPGFKSYGWSDSKHLLIEEKIGQKRDMQQFDVVSGQVSPLVASSAGETPGTSKQYPDLTLDVEPRIQEDDKGSGGHLDSRLVWIRRTPAGKMPLGVAAAGLTPGNDDPQAIWSPTGRQVAFLSRGDLWVTDLTSPTDLLAAEKMAVGLTLTCAEERQLAESNLKQIGLAIIQYCQDNDEHFPPSAGVNESIYPYLKTREVFQVGNHPFVYLLPGGSPLVKMDNPAETEEGMIDLPCARVVLMADGHVKSFPKPDAP